MSDELSTWKLIIAIIASFLAMMGFNYRWIQNATNKECVLKPDCKEDRDALKEYVQEIKTDLHKRIDRMEINLLKAIRGN